ncbi:coil containing protein [Vibrio phage 1.189.B._10N.286.51.B5]|nr:coil containing protein [Vibrio phage 1.189.B._10N.286.51.B5]AUR93955.1 coil containing protein [Vibrio phage 1.189.C._10N.286.51.B5]AUR94021.1 coil containing protein [Vibrio phage 1.189.O._10N.286.51.B5]
MTKEQEIALLYRLIEEHYGSGVLMRFADLVQEVEEDE